jgi:hypothetical protein
MQGQMAAASTSTFLSLFKNRRCHKKKSAFFTGFLGVNLGNINFFC